MNQNIRKVAGKGLKVSHKILCLLLACTLLIQTGCQTTHVLQTVEREEQKTDEHKHLDLKPGQLVRLTYQKGTSTKTLIGRIKSATSDAIVVTYNPGFRNKEVSVSFEHIKKIELIKKEPSIVKSFLLSTTISAIVFSILTLISYGQLVSE